MFIIQFNLVTVNRSIMSINIQPIATIRSPYKDKFAIPRQPGLVKSAIGEIIFSQQFNDPNYNFLKNGCII